MAFRINLGSLTVQIGANTEDFEQGQTRVRQDIRRTDSELRKSVNSFGKWAGAAAAAAAVAVAAFAKTQLSAIKELKNVAQAANVTVKEFQRGAFAASQFGIETEKYGDILKDVNDKIGDFSATGGGEMLEFFSKIAPKVGVTIEQFKNLSGQQALGLYVDTLQKANVSQQEMTFFMEAIANDSTRLIPLFSDSGEALKKLTKEAENLGIGLDSIDLIKASIANEEFAKTVAATDSLAKKITISLTPAITGITKAFNESAITAGGWQAVISSAVDIAVKALGVMWDGVRGIQIIFKGLEVVVRTVFTSMTKIFDNFINKGLKDIGLSIVNSVIKPFKSALEMVSGFSDTAKNALISIDDTINNLFDKPREGLGGFAQSQVDALAKSKEELAALALQELPSIALERTTQAAFDAFDKEVAKRAAEEKEKADNKTDKPTQTAAEKSESDKIREETSKILEALLEQGRVKEETQFEHLARQQTILDEALQKKKITQQQFDNASAALTKKTEQAKVNAVSGAMGAISTILQVLGKKNSKIVKAAAVADAVVTGYKSAVSAFAIGMETGGPYLAAAYTAASLLKTGALIGKIKSGGSSQSSSAGGGFSASSTTQSVTSQAQGQQGPARRLELHLTGDSTGSMSIEKVRELMGQIVDQANDGVDFVGVPA